MSSSWYLGGCRELGAVGAAGHGQEDIVVNVLRGAVEPYVYLLAVAPDRVEPQPEGPYTAEELTGWILDRISTSRPDRYSRSEIRLPAGPAVEVRFYFDGEMGHFEAVEGTAYAVSTSEGIAYLQIHMSESLLSEFGSAMAEVPPHLSLVDASP